jgi:phage-related protein
LIYDYLATIIIDYRSRIDSESIKINLNKKLEEFKNNLELIIIFDKNSKVNELIDQLNVNVPITVIENDELLPSLENIGIGDIKFLINEFSISQLSDVNKSENALFLGRRANIFFH